MECPLGDSNSQKLDARMRRRGWARHGVFIYSFRAVEPRRWTYDWVGFSSYFNLCAGNADSFSPFKMAVVQMAQPSVPWRFV